MIGRLPGPGLRQTGIVVIILFLGGLAACGGGSRSQPPPPSGGGGGGGGSAVAPFFFGMHINNPNSPFPSTANVPIAGVRLWDTQTSWATTNTSSGVYDWTSLDFRVNQALTNKVDVLYDFARTPAWAQCANNNPQCGSADTTITCAYAMIPPPEGGPGECFPPNDLNKDGSGPNQHWIDWVTAVVTRYKGKISYYEIWNEPNNTAMWQGTNAQLVRLAGDARCIIVGDKGCNPQSTYSQTKIDPPVFDTEGSWGASGGISSISDPDQQAAFTARYLLVQQSAGIQRLYWYGWDLASGNGTLWTSSSGLTLAGVAYQQTELWVSGATLTAPGCAANGSVWTCAYTRSGGYQALVVWDASQTCSNGSCTTSTFTLPSSPQFTQYQDLAGNTHAVSGTVAIGAKPILLETGNIP